MQTEVSDQQRADSCPCLHVFRVHMHHHAAQRLNQSARTVYYHLLSAPSNWHCTRSNQRQRAGATVWRERTRQRARVRVRFGTVELVEGLAGGSSSLCSSTRLRQHNIPACGPGTGSPEPGAPAGARRHPRSHLPSEPGYSGARGSGSHSPARGSFHPRRGAREPVRALTRAFTKLKKVRLSATGLGARVCVCMYVCVSVRVAAPRPACTHLALCAGFFFPPLSLRVRADRL